MTKRLVVCADGTWNDPDQTQAGRLAVTHVVKLASAVRPEAPDGRAQLVAYHKGVGERGGLWDKITGGAFGVGISDNIQELYRFLVMNFAPGDELWFFGFSRGAYTVRSLAGLVRNCGILKRDHFQRCGEAYDLYREPGKEAHPKGPKAVAFRERYAWPASEAVHFIGVWDTVGALGIPVRPLRFWTRPLYEFHDVELSSHVAYAYQALALDERRKPFVPTLWKRQADSPASQVMEQAWFPGVHSDVGGGYAETGLSDLALAWLWDRAQRAGLGLDPALRPTGDPAAPAHDSLTWFYRLMGKGERSPGAGGIPAAETLHRSVPERQRRLPGYGSLGLERFMAQGPVVSEP